MSQNVTSVGRLDADQVRSALDAAGLAASFLPQAVEVAPARAELRRLLGGGLWPHIVLRFGVATPTPKTAGRPLADVMLGPVRITA